jgi:hypothetical protein
LLYATGLQYSATSLTPNHGAYNRLVQLLVFLEYTMLRLNNITIAVHAGNVMEWQSFAGDVEKSNPLTAASNCASASPQRVRYSGQR